MGRHGCLFRVIMVSFIIKGLVVQQSQTKASISVDKKGNNVLLKCEASSASVTWKKDGTTLPENATDLDLGPEADDPRGIFQCDDSVPLQVYLRMCQNCIELDAATISGILVADIIATAFLAIAVYCIAGHDGGRLSRASDRQNLIASEQLYQPLGERDSEPYSRLGVARTRK
ncbi:T-cell surface glycoprotein CD3 gamma chain-like [Carettochelys insculpta]|uniref:T-cell surface glycoprotein CD3 gamma chain-like n=1 Tax=Carettochelys insculpta TaxID=44489 RepID=UPI003EBA731C